MKINAGKEQTTKSLRKYTEKNDEYMPRNRLRNGKTPNPKFQVSVCIEVKNHVVLF